MGIQDDVKLEKKICVIGYRMRLKGGQITSSSVIRVDREGDLRAQRGWEELDDHGLRGLTDKPRSQSREVSGKTGTHLFQLMFSAPAAFVTTRGFQVGDLSAWNMLQLTDIFHSHSC